MYLTAHLRHTVDEAALDGIGKILCIRGGIIFLINVEMYLHTITGTLLYRCRNAHSENIGILPGRTHHTLFTAQLIGAD